MLRMRFLRMAGETAAEGGGYQCLGGDGEPEHEPGERFRERQVSHPAEGQGGDAVHAEREDDALQGGLVGERPVPPNLPPGRTAPAVGEGVRGAQTAPVTAELRLAAGEGRRPLLGERALALQVVG